jgi:hypothetical protein
MFGRIQVASLAERGMRVSWVFAVGYTLDPAIDPESIKSVGPSWGSWQTWRGCNTDNVICDQRAKAKELIDRAFQAVCNFHIRKSYYAELGRPVGVKLYEGDFDLACENIEDIVAMHLAKEQSDIIILAGFNLAEVTAPKDPLERHKKANRHGLIYSILAHSDAVQWVVIDHAADLDQSYQNLANLTCDKMDNVLKLLV